MQGVTNACSSQLFRREASVCLRVEGFAEYASMHKAQPQEAGLRSLEPAKLGTA